MNRRSNGAWPAAHVRVLLVSNLSPIPAWAKGRAMPGTRRAAKLLGGRRSSALTRLGSAGSFERLCHTAGLKDSRLHDSSIGSCWQRPERYRVPPRPTSPASERLAESLARAPDRHLGDTERPPDPVFGDGRYGRHALHRAPRRGPCGPSAAAMRRRHSAPHVQMRQTVPLGLGGANPRNQPPPPSSRKSGGRAGGRFHPLDGRRVNDSFRELSELDVRPL